MFQQFESFRVIIYMFRTETRTVRHSNIEETISNILHETSLESIRNNCTLCTCESTHRLEYLKWRFFTDIQYSESPSFRSKCAELCGEFCQWFFHQCALQPDFSPYMLFIDEVTFTQRGVFNVQIIQGRAHSTQPHALQNRFSLNSWESIERFSHSPIYTTNTTHYNSSRYRIFLEDF